MNNFFRKKNNRPKIIAIFVLLLFIVVYACEKELSNSSSENEEAQAIEKAKAWYEANKPEETLLRSSDGKNKMSMSPVWKNAYTMKNDKYEMIETDLMSYGRILYLDEECVQKAEETQNPYYRQCYTHLVFRINRATKDTVGFLMTMVPNVEWLEKSKFSPFLESSYLYRAKQYGGAVLFHYMDGSFSNGWRYEKGKIVAKISSLGVDSASFELRSTVCHPVTYLVPHEDCVDLYIGTEVNGVDQFFKVGSNCKTTYETQTSEECYDDGTDPNAGGVPDPPPNSGSGGGGSGNGNPTNNSAPGTNGVPYTPQSTDKMAKKNLATTMIKQYANTCVTSIMEYINNKVFGGNVNEGTYIAGYAQAYNEMVLIDGVAIKNIASFTNMYFTTSTFSSFQDAINSGAVVMTDVTSNIANSTHNVVVVGYQPSGNYIYMDPEQGCFQTGGESSFKKDYVIYITGIK